MQKQFLDFLNLIDAKENNLTDTSVIATETDFLPSADGFDTGDASLKSVGAPISDSTLLLGSTVDRPASDLVNLQRTADQRTSSYAVAASPNSETIASSLTGNLLANTSPFVVANDGLGASGSREFAANLSAIASIGNSAGRFCAGTLIAPSVLVSARHCDISGGDEVVFGSDLSNPDFTVSVQSVTLPGGPADSQQFLDGDDVAIVFLSEDVPQDIAQPVLLTTQTDALVGGIATIAGYGLNGLGSAGNLETSDGFRWGGQNIIDFYGEFGGGENLFFADFDDGSEFGNTLEVQGSSQIPLEREAIVSEGDSGSPLLFQIGDQLVLAGVTTGGLDLNGEYGSFAFWTGVARFQGQLALAGAEFVEGTEGDSPIVSDPEDTDDHSNSQFLATTGLQFTDNGNRSIARAKGTLGFGDTAADKDVFSFETSSDGRIIVDARGRSADVDTVVEVFDSEGNLLGRNDDTANRDANNPNDSQLILRNVEAGEYFAVVSGSNDSTGDYRVAVRTNADISAEADSHGDNFADASRIVLNSLSSSTFITSTIDSPTDNDFFEVTAARTGRLIVRTVGLTRNVNTILRGFDSERNLLDANNNFGDGVDSRIRLDVVAGESYSLRLNSARQTFGDYRISLRLEGDVGNGTIPLTEFSAATPTDSPVASLDETSLAGQNLFAV